jgi:alanine racemase
VSGDRWAWAEIDLGALDRNVRHLRDVVAPAAVWAVVKADGYGHGADAVAAQALRSGASGLCVALAQEGLALRRAGIEAPILVLSEQPQAQVSSMLTARLIPTVYSPAYVDAIAAALASLPTVRTCEVHVKVDTGMQRVGAQPSAVPALLGRIAALSPAVRVSGFFTHLACADDPGSDANQRQLDDFGDVLSTIDPVDGRLPVVHAANSAAAIALPESRFDLVRAGIAIYGISPGPGVDDLARGLLPVMSLRARVSHVKRVAAGSHVSYGWRHEFDRDTTVATVPIGYADGVPRRLGTLPDRPGADVLIGGRRCPIVGVVTMDQLMVDVGSFDRDGAVAIGDEVVLIGRQGDEVICARDWAERLGTIGYEVVCGIGARVPRLVRSGTPEGP